MVIRIHYRLVIGYVDKYVGEETNKSTKESGETK